MRIPSPIRRLAAITKRKMGDLITITETLVYTLTEALVIVTDYIVMTKNSIFKLLGFSETITFSDKVIQIFKPIKNIIISDLLAIKIYLLEQLSTIKSIILRINISESIPIAEKSISKFFYSKLLDISDRIKTTIRLKEALSFTKSLLTRFHVSEAISIVDNSISRFLSSKSLSISDGIRNITVKLKDSLSTTRSLLLKILSIDESIPISDRSIYKFFSSKSLDISDGIKRITVRFRESLSSVKSLLLELHLPESITIGDKSISKYFVSKLQSISDISLASIRLRVVDSLSSTKQLLLQTLSPESFSIQDKSISKFIGSKILNISDGIKGVVFKFKDTLSITKSAILKVLSIDESIPISDKSILRSLISKLYNISDTLLVDLTFKISEALSITKQLLLQILSPEPFPIQDKSISRLFISKVYDIFDSSLISVKLWVSDSLSSVKQLILQTLSLESFSIADRSISTFLSSKILGISDGLKNIALRVRESLSTTKSIILKVLTNESISISDKYSPRLFVSKLYDISDTFLADMIFKVTESLSSTRRLLLRTLSPEGLPITDRSILRLFISKIYDISDSSLTRVRLIVAETLSSTKQLLLRILSPESLLIQDKSILRLFVSKLQGITDALIVDTIFRISDFLSVTKRLLLQVLSTESVPIQDRSISRLFASRVYEALDSSLTSARLWVVESLSNTKQLLLRTLSLESFPLQDKSIISIFYSRVLSVTDSLRAKLTVRDTVDYIKDLIFRVVPSESMVITDTTRLFKFAVSKVYDISDSVSGLLIKLRDTLSLSKISKLGILGIDEPVLIADEVSETTAKGSRSLSISDRIGNVILGIKEELSHIKSIVVNFSLSESFPLTDKSISRFFSSKIHSISDSHLTTIRFKLSDSLSSVKQLLLKTISPESFPVADRSISRFFSSKILDISDGIKGITLRIKDTLLLTKSILLKLLSIDESISISDNVVSRFLISKYHDIADSLSYMRFRLGESLSFTKDLLFRVSTSESISITDIVSLSKHFLSKVYDATDSMISQVLIKLSDTLSLSTDALKLKILGIKDSIIISDSVSLSGYILSKAYDITDSIFSSILVRIEDTLSFTKDLGLKILGITDSIPISDKSISRISSSKSFNISDKIKNVAIKLKDSLSITKSAILNVIPRDSISISDIISLSKFRFSRGSPSPPTQGLALEYLMDELTGTTLADTSGGENTGLVLPAFITVEDCESLADFTGTSLSLDTDKIEGTYSVKDVVASPIAATEYKTTYNPSGTWNWRSRYELNYWIKVNRPDSAFTWSRLYAYDSDSHYRYWDLTFDADEWIRPWSFMSYLINNEYGGKDNSDGGSAVMVSDCESSTNWSTDLVSGSITNPKSTKQGDYSVRAYTSGVNVQVDTEYYIRYTLPSTQDWSSNSYLHFFFGSCVPSAEYNYIRFYIYDTDGDWAYWELSKIYALLRGMVIDLSNPTVEAGGGLDLTKVAYIQWIVSRSIITRAYQEMWVDWIRLDDLHTEKVDKLEWNFKAADTTTFTRRLDAIKLDGGPLVGSGKYGGGRQGNRRGYIRSTNKTPLVDSGDLTVIGRFKPDISDPCWMSWLFYKRWGMAIYSHSNYLYTLCYDQVGGKGIGQSFTWENRWYFYMFRVQQESVPDEHDGILDYKLYNSDGLVASGSRSDFGTTSQSDATHWYIGRTYWGCFNNDYFEGPLDEFRVYTRTLTDDEVDQFIRQGVFYSITDYLSYVAIARVQDSLSFIKGLFHKVSTIESISIADTMSTLQSSLSKTYDAADSVTKQVLVKLSDTLSLSLGTLKLKILGVTDSINISDSISLSRHALSKAHDISDNILSTLRLKLSDSLSFAKGALKLERGFTESISPSDSVEEYGFTSSRIVSVSELKEIDALMRKQDSLGTSKHYLGEKTCTVCYTCDACDSCVTCEACEAGCHSCDQCEGTCFTCYQCAVCDVCDSCEGSCYTCDSCVGGCDWCEACYKCNVACYTCDTGCQISCQTCEDCDACDVCNTGCQATCQTCEQCAICDVCNVCQGSCQTCMSCHGGCDLCEACYRCNVSCYDCDTGCQGSCQTCQNCYTGCYDCYNCEGSCYTCVTCVGGCDTCEACYVCAVACYNCDTCQASCQTCETCVSGCYNCYNCEICVVQM